MKVLFLAEINSIHFRRWAQAMTQHGITVGVYSLSAPHDSWHTENGIEILSKPVKSNSTKWSYFLKANGVRLAIKHFNPDIVHAHYASSYGMLARRAGFHPCIISVWGSDIMKFPKKHIFNRIILKKNLAFADVILATGNVLKKETEKYVRKNIVLTPFGIDTSLFSPVIQPDKSVFTIACAKSMEKIYGIDILIKAVIEIHKNHPQIRLKLAGDGSQLVNYQHLVSQSGINEVVQFCGALPHAKIPEFYSSSNVAVFLSESESFGVSVLEASACQIPVICSQAIGFNDVMVDGVTGFRVKRENTRDIVQAISDIMKNRTKAEEMGKAGRKWVIEKYEWSSCVKGMLTVYNHFSSYQ